MELTAFGKLGESVHFVVGAVLDHRWLPREGPGYPVPSTPLTHAAAYSQVD